MTSRETIFAFGAPPTYPDADPARTPATNVPCPRPSPGLFGTRDVIVTCLITRPPKSVRPASTPESTTATVGACTPVFCILSQNFDSSD
jgi:hypothetical protein